MKKIITQKTQGNVLIVERIKKVISERITKEYSFKELRKDKVKALEECEKLVPAFAEVVNSYKKISTSYNEKKHKGSFNHLCVNFIKEFYDLINSRFIDNAIRAMIILTWDFVIKKYLKETKKRYDLMGFEIAMILLGCISTELEVMGLK